MAIKVIMPKVDMDQDTGTVVEWRKNNGDEVKKGEIILVIETNKVAVDVESPGSGILKGISAAPGEVIPISTVIAYILAPGEALPDDHERTSPKAEVTAASIPDQRATPIAKNIAAVNGLDLKAIAPSGKGDRITKADVVAQLPCSDLAGGDGKVYASPAARRISRENQVDLAYIKGSGPQGRVQSNDVLAYAAGQERVASQAGSGAAEPQVIPLVGMRRTIAERMTSSYQSIPHLRFTARVNMTKLIETRKKLNALAEKRGEQDISATVLMIKLAAHTLRHHPFLNSSLSDDTILLHKEINIGVAVALENGLIVPVVKHADTKSVTEIAVELNDLVSRARAGALAIADVKGATFTISNLGPFGVEQFDAIINPPEAAILAIGTIQLEALPNEDGQIASCPVMRMTLSADHRIVDGAIAARFLSDLKAAFEDPILMTY